MQRLKRIRVNTSFFNIITSGIIIARLNVMKLHDSDPSDLHGLSEKSA